MEKPLNKPNEKKGDGGSVDQRSPHRIDSGGDG